MSCSNTELMTDDSEAFYRVPMPHRSPSGILPREWGNGRDAAMQCEALVQQHYRVAGLLAAIEQGLKAAGKNLDSITVDDLAPVDAFHSRGREATVELAALAPLSASDRVIDIGCGLGGTARFLAARFACCVAGIDLAVDYVEVGQELTRRAGLSDRVFLHQGTALALPFDDQSFDLAWTEHAQMNIPDKARFYSEIARVLKPGGRLCFHDIFRGQGEAPSYPMPWAEDQTISALATIEEARQAMGQAGLEIECWNEKVGDTLAYFEFVAMQLAAGTAPPMSIRLLMRDTADRKLSNYVRALRAGQLTVALGTAVRS